MKKFTLLIISAALLLSGCSSDENSGVSLTGSETASNAAEAGAEAAAATSEPSAGFEPPLLRLELNNGETRTCVDLTAGSYTWDEDNVSRSAQADPITLAESSSGIATVNAEELTENPALLTDGGRIISAVCFRDSLDSRPCEISDNRIALCGDSAYNVYSVTVDYGQGVCEYVFQTVGAEPPILRLRAGNTYRALSRNNYEWQEQHGDETFDTVACGASPWQSRETAPRIDLSGETKAVVMLPDDAEIENVCVYSDEDSCEYPEFSGRTFELPADPNNKVYAVNVIYPKGRCEYVFSTFVDGGSADFNAWSESSEICGYPRREDCYAETSEAAPDLSVQTAQSAQPTQPDPPVQTDPPTYCPPAPSTSHHRESHHNHHNFSQQKPCNYISGCDPDNLSFYAYGYEVNTEENYKRDYEGEITDKEVIAELWDIITGQELQSEVTGDYTYTGTPYIEITDRSDGKVYTVSYTSSIIYGSCHGSCPAVEGHVCETPDKYVPCMRISCGISTEYAVLDGEQERRFNELVINSLKQYEPTRDAVFNKTAKTDWIVFVYRYTNYAWDPTDNGYFIDCYGNKYEFDFSGKRLNGNGSEEVFNALWQVYCDNDPVERGLYDEEKLFDILIDDICAIDENAEVSKEPGGADMGQATLYAVDLDGRMIELRSEGDWDCCLEDETAKRLCDFFDNERLS